MESVLVTCPHCHAVNRIPQVRLGDHPDCGRCHRPLFDGLPIELRWDPAGFFRAS